MRLQKILLFLLLISLASLGCVLGGMQHPVITTPPFDYASISVSPEEAWYGDTCTVTVRLPPNGICYDAKAYIGSWSDVAPPATVISESSTVRYCGRPFCP